MKAQDATFEGLDCALTVRRAAPGLVVVLFSGNDIGEFGAKPFEEIEKEIAARGSIELFIDARGAKGASTDVSGDWAVWLKSRKGSLRRVSMLTGSRFIQLSADFVRKFADLGDVMRIYSDPAAFEAALAEASIR